MTLLTLRPAPPRLWLPVLIGMGAICLGLLGVVLFASDDSGSEAPGVVLDTTEALRQPVHWHADFAVVINGQQFDFNQSGFISTEGGEKNPWVHIHDPRPTVIHVHREQTTWDEFFGSLGFKLTDTSLTLPNGTNYTSGEGGTLRFFVNRVRVDTIQFESIADLSQGLVTFGPESEEDIRRTQIPLVTDQACIPSELCLYRVPAVPELEPCTKSSGSCTG